MDQSKSDATDNTSCARKRSFSWSEGQQVEDEVVQRSEELLETLNRRLSDVTEGTDRVRSSLEEVHRSARQLRKARRHSYLLAVEEAGIEFDTEQNAFVDKEGHSPAAAQIPASKPSKTSWRNVPRLGRTQSFNRDLSLVSSLVTEENDQLLVEPVHSLPSSETDSTVTPVLKEPYEVKCEQQADSPLRGSSTELVICPLERFKFVGQLEEVVASPSSKTYADLKTTLTDKGHVWV